MKRLLGLLCCLLTACATPSMHHAIVNHNDDWFGVDKLAHFGASAAIAASVTNYRESHGSSGCDAARTGFAITMTIGAGKELYDKNIKRTFWSWEDLTWDMMGGIVGSLAAADC